jgi:SAM-dependent MidA family methyltransferase
MELALYDSESGYYARAAQRSGRAGDFFTSVDVGPVFGELLARQVIEMAGLLDDQSSVVSRQSSVVSHQSSVDLVEAGAGNGRLSADILRAVHRESPALYDRLRLHLVEASGSARAAQRETLGDVADRLASSSPRLPESFSGILIANELLDAMPVHQVVMRPEGLREIYVTTGDSRRETEDWRLKTTEGAPSTPALAEHLDRAGVKLEPGWRVEINLRAVEWVREAVRRLTRGFIILIDYGHPARELYSATHATGTLTTFSRHTTAGPERPGGQPPWLEHPGEQDITAHVDFSSVRRAAEDEGAEAIALLDQTYFLLGLGAAEIEAPELKTRLAIKTLLMPGGLGSTLKVLIVGKGVERPSLRGCSFGVRLT